jgi:hypothetical protein
VHGEATGIDGSICASNRITALISSLDPSSVGGTSAQNFLLQEMVGLRKALLAAKSAKPSRAVQKVERARQVLSVFTKIVKRNGKRGVIKPPSLALQILDLATQAKNSLPSKAELRRLASQARK